MRAPWWPGVGLLALTALAGCMRSPSFNVLGSYFPGWIVCLLAGVLVAAVLRWGMDRVGWARRLPLSPVFHFCVAVLVACVVWLVVFE